MAHNKKALSRYATSDMGGQNQTNFYKYSTDSTAAEVLADGFFNDSRKTLKAGDVITAVVDKDGTPDILTILVDTVPSTGDVTTSAETGASGA
ncbi:MAG: hypothetical protein JJ866_15750 [Roseibium sp.]|uniref:hypothetical protein n=1 Tax=Roseibium sp. TaxID=1936156 RepID=UPI001B0C8107|nr:hypothetical protein [Roseibium sp.]MBO6893397.1 hypothetical protein [Roseibium sp.]MBO6930727.1 hypothetical protein [Roseibium sp.]